MTELIYKYKHDIENKLAHDADYKDKIIRGEQVKELTDILDHVRANTEFYSDIESSDIGLFPVVNKKILKDNYDKIFVKEYTDKTTFTKHTSGSTGTPFSVIHDAEKRCRHIADLKYFGELAGYKDLESLCYLRAMPVASEEQQRKDNVWQLDICNLSEENLTEYYHIMIEKKCVALLAYASTLETAVNFWSKKFPENKLYIKSVICISETLTMEVREKLASYFGEDVVIRARYSNTENGILGQEIGIPDNYVLNWASYYFEVLKLESDEPAEEGELGRIVITDLYNKAFPLIRYDTGDVAVMMRSKDDFPRFTSLLGRRMDLIINTKDQIISPFLISQTMKSAKGIEQWQFIQKTKHDYLIKATIAKECERPSFEYEIDKFKLVLGEDINISVEYVDEIPVLNSLKRKMIISEL